MPFSMRLQAVIYLDPAKFDWCDNMLISFMIRPQFLVSRPYFLTRLQDAHEKFGLGMRLSALGATQPLPLVLQTYSRV